MAETKGSTHKPSTNAKCDCQWDDHFNDKPVPGTRRHAYGARVTRSDLQPAGTGPTGHVFMECGPCRAHHTTAALVAKVRGA